jgi:thioredoxin 1
MSLLHKIFGAPTPKKPPVHVTDATFQELVLDSDIPVVVDFWGEGCPPCKRLEPVVMQLAGAFEGQVRVCEAPIRETLGAAQALGIRSTPTVIYFMPGGKVVERVIGFRGWAYHEEIVRTDLLGEDRGG